MRNLMRNKLVSKLFNDEINPIITFEDLNSQELTQYRTKTGSNKPPKIPSSIEIKQCTVSNNMLLWLVLVIMSMIAALASSVGGYLGAAILFGVLFAISVIGWFGSMGAWDRDQD